MSLERYKRLLAQRIAELNPSKVYPGNPQAMLRSVIVIKYVVDANGKLVSADTLRSNGDGETVSTALGAIRHAAPFPAPPHRLLNRGHLEILETMLFNDDGRFQMRSIAAPQLDE
jgi:protein TonB